MDLNTIAAERRSIRNYEAGHTVTEEQLIALIRFAQNAPSWKNTQTARYYIAHTAEAIAAVKNCLPDFNAKRCENAVALIVTAFESEVSGFSKGAADNELGNEWGAYDLGMQNMLLLLKAREMGMDTLVMGLRDSEALRNVCHIPESQHVGAVLSLGYRAADPAMPPRKDITEVATLL